MSIQTEIDRISGNVSAALSAIVEKGVTVPDGSTSDALAELIASIEAGGGGYEVTYGVITPVGDNTTISWEHGLSKAPEFVLIFMGLGYRYTTFANSLRTFYKRNTSSIGNVNEQYDAYVTSYSTSDIVHANSMSSGQSPFTVNDTTVTANECNFGFLNAMKWLSGKPYYWICIAGDIVFPYK